jgi:hypothetical protein
MMSLSEARLDVLSAAARIEALSKERPDMFDEKRRAEGVWLRATCWSIGALIGTAASYFVRGHARNPTDFILGLLFAMVLVYFDPPKVRTILTLRAASADTHPKDGDSTEIEAPLVSGAVPSETSADAP